MDVARQLPPESGKVVVAAANGAFLRGLVLCEVISGVGTLVLAIYAAARFCRVGVLPKHTGEHQAGVNA